MHNKYSLPQNQQLNLREKQPVAAKNQTQLFLSDFIFRLLLTTTTVGKLICKYVHWTAVSYISDQHLQKAELQFGRI